MEDIVILNHEFKTGDVLTAKDLNDILNAISILKNKIEELDANINGSTAE